MPNNISHFVIGSHDVPKSAEFYAKLFGWSMTPEDQNQNLRIDTGGKVGGHLVPTDEHSFTSFFVRVDDLDSTLKRAVELGGRVITPPEVNARGTRFAMIMDCDCAVVGVLEVSKQKGTENG